MGGPSGATVGGSVLAVARNRALVRLLTAFCSFTVYEQIAWVAVLLWAYANGGVALAGLVAVVQLVPSALVAPLGSMMGDRLPRGLALFAAYGAQSVLLGLTAALLLSGSPAWAVLGAATAACAAIALTRPIHYAASPAISRRADEAVAANSFSGLWEALGLLLGPVLAGIGSAAAGPGPVLAGTAVMAAASALSCVRLGPGTGTVGARDGGPLRTALGGLVALRHDRPAAVLLGLVGSLFLVMGAVEILVVAYVAGPLEGDDAQAGFLLGAIGVGGLAGAVVSVVLVAWRRLAPAVVLGLVVGGATLALLAAAPRLVVAAGLLASVGLGKSFFEVAGRTMLQRAVDTGVLSRVFGIQESVTLLALAAGAAVAPPLVGWLGPTGAFLPLGLALPVLAAASWRSMVVLDSRAVYRPELLGLLRHHPFLRHLPVPVLGGLAAAAEELSVPAGDTVVREGEPGDRYYLIEEGDVLVTATGSSTAVEVGAGDGFGEIALLRSVPRTATVTTASSCRLWAITQEDFLAGLGASPAGTSAAQDEVRTKARRMGPDNLRGEAADGTD
ncbi:MAG TPA: MFS transporter [Jiangellales bacterium]|nr:MFS transporter [Jiangellales bacterium]